MSLTSAVSVTWHSIGISLRATAKSVVGDSTGREIRRLSVNHNELKASNNNTLCYSSVYIRSIRLKICKDGCIRCKNGAIGKDNRNNRKT